ncbi:hypothetical protein [Mycolicibacterium sediminis]|uniref:Uncharacterized protein n=1 Tax=Mycolicibacterium sediminis TaxID=1286180 RepID=A0A7I7QVK7_9MYCO|nr:hypothetical protein [Mycolicibacterium sediminis]BBY30027.1 hypothetical protein MSEDJ_41230 [Mycolicibacterium sediminis]
MARNNQDDGPVKAVSALIVGVIFVVSLVPKEVWITLGILVAVALLAWGTAHVVSETQQRRAAAEARAEVQRKAEVAAAKRAREAAALREKQERVTALGTQNASRVESALAAAMRVAESEAARAGWLGDVDFSADIREITEGFRQARALRDTAGQLSALTKPGPDDRRMVAEATTTAATLERAALERAELIGQCSAEARRIDQTLHERRVDARTAEQRAELHGRLGAMLYGIEAAPGPQPENSAADAVLARVRAYREIESRIHQARES